MTRINWSAMNDAIEEVAMNATLEELRQAVIYGPPILGKIFAEYQKQAQSKIDGSSLQEMAKRSGITNALDYGEAMPEEYIEAFAHMIIDWVAEQHKIEKGEYSPVQMWIRMLKNRISNRVVEEGIQALEALGQ